MSEEKKSVFETLNAINVNGHTEQKCGLTYLSWAWAWAEVKKRYPKATFTTFENENGWNYFTDGKTAWVKVQVNIEDESVTETLPVMDYKNQSVLLNQLTSMAVNKAIKRCLVKALALMGLGLYIYAGEDFPEEEQTAPVQQQQVVQQTPQQDARTTANSQIASSNISGSNTRYSLAELMNDYRDTLSSVKMSDGKTYLQFLDPYVGSPEENEVIASVIDWLQKNNIWKK